MQMGYAPENPTWRNAYLSVANELWYGMPKCNKNHRILRDVLKRMQPILLLNSLIIRINGNLASDKTFTINWHIAGTDVSCHSELSNAVLIHREGAVSKVNLMVSLSKRMLAEFVLGYIATEDISGTDVRITGDINVLDQLVDLLDIFPAWFPIATHVLKVGDNS